MYAQVQRKVTIWTLAANVERGRYLTGLGKPQSGSEPSTLKPHLAEIRRSWRFLVPSK